MKKTKKSTEVFVPLDKKIRLKWEKYVNEKYPKGSTLNPKASAHEKELRDKIDDLVVLIRDRDELRRAFKTVELMFESWRFRPFPEELEEE